MSNGLKGAPGFMMPALRIAWRDRYGDMPALIDAARDELKAGRLTNAWLAYQIALNQWLRIACDTPPDEPDAGRLHTVRYMRRC